MGNSQSSKNDDAMDVDPSPRPVQPRMTEFFAAFPGRDPRWNRTQLRSKLPVEILKKIVEWAKPSTEGGRHPERASPLSWTLGPKCRYRADLEFHDYPCGCSACRCHCYETRDLARKLGEVSFVFRELVDRREWQCVVLGSHPMLRWIKLFDAIEANPDLVEDTLGRVENCDLHVRDKVVREDYSDSEADSEADEADEPGGADRPVSDCMARSVRMMKRLKRLAVQPYSYSFRDATGPLEALTVLAHLRSLQLDGVTFTAEALRSCLRAARGLKILFVAGEIAVDDEAIFEAVADSVAPGLESLTIYARSNVDVDDDDSYEEELSTAMRDRHMQGIVAAVNDLKELNLEHCGKLTDASIAPALAKFGSLRILSLKWCAGVTDASLSELRSSALLELELDCAAVTDRSIVPVLQKNFGLRSLSLRKTNVSDAIGSHLSALRTNLKNLSVSRTAITWPALRPFVLSKPPKLEDLAISYVAGVDDDAVRCIRDNLDGLESLRMGGCAGITRPEVLLYTTFKLQGSLTTICLEGVPIADDDLMDAMRRITGDELFFSSRD